MPPPAAPAVLLELFAAEGVSAAAMEGLGWEVDVLVVEDVVEREVEEVEVEVELGFTFVTWPLMIQLPRP